jgi:hypothetical protein
MSLHLEPHDKITPECMRQIGLRQLKRASRLLFLLVAFGYRLFTFQLLVQIFLTDRRDEKWEIGGTDGI